MDLENIMLSEICQRKSYTIYRLHVESKKQNIPMCIEKERFTYVENKLVFTSGEREGASSKVELWDLVI